MFRFLISGLYLAATPNLLASEGLPVEELTRETKVDFATEVVPFLRKNCFACHNEQKAKGDLNLESPEAMITGGDSGPALVPGKPMESLLFLTAAHLEEEFMPPSSNKSNAVNLNPSELALLRLWIEQGGEGASSSILAGPIEWEPLEGVHASYAVTISDDSRFAATGNGNRLYVYDLRTGNLEAELVDEVASPGTAHHDLIHTLAFNPEGILASGGYRSVKIWERNLIAATDLEIPSLEGTSALSIHVGGTQAAAGDNTGHVALVDISQSTTPVVFKVHETTVKALRLSSDRRHLFTTSDDKTVARVDLSDTSRISRVDLPSGGRSLALLEDGTKLAVGCADGIIRIIAISGFNPDAGELAEPTAPTEWKTEGEVLALSAIGAPEAQVLSATTAGSIQVWDASGKVIRTFSHGSAISTVAIDEGTGQIAAAGEDGVIRIWSAVDGKLQHELKGDLDFQQQRGRAGQDLELARRVAELRGKQVEETTNLLDQLKTKAEAEDKKVAEAQKDLQAKQATASQREQESETAKKRVTELKSSGDPGLEAAEGAAKKASEESTKAENERVTADRNLRNAERSRDLLVKDTARAVQRLEDAESSSMEAGQALAGTEKMVQELEQKAAQLKPSTVRALNFSADGTTLAVSTDETGLRLWSTDTGQPLDIIHPAPVSAVIFGPGDQILASTSSKGLLHWNRTTQWKIRRTLGDQNREDPFPGRVLSLAFHPDGHLLATGSGVPSRDGSLSLWNLSDGQRKGVIKAHQDTITGLAFSPDGRRIASSSTDRYIRIHTVDTLEMQDQLEGHTSHVLDVAWSADGQTIASAGADHVGKLWDVATKKQKKTESGFKKELTTIAFVGIGETIVMGGGDKILKTSGQNLPGIDESIYDAAVSPDGSIILAGGESGTLRIWQASDRKLLYSFPPAGKAPSETASK